MDRLEALRQQILLQNPTDQQKDAIFADELGFLLRAAPGSGKTWTSCRRFIWRGANWPHAVGGLALLSFTNVAIREFQEATIDVGMRHLLSDPNYVGTFDSFVERFVLSPFGHLTNKSTKRPKLFLAPRSGDRSNKKLYVWTDLAGGKNCEVPAWEIIPYPENGKVAFKTSRKLGTLQIDQSGYGAICELFRLGFYTHAQRVYWACNLLLARPHIAQLIARRFPEIIVDEAQDTNVWLLLLLNILHERGTQITVIGDPDQCIYEFSMADSTSLLELKDKWKLPEKPLSQSFRCNNQIAGAVRNISGNMAFVGCGDGQNPYRRPFIVRDSSESHAESIAAFQQLLVRAEVKELASAILCRGHQQLEAIRGEVNYFDLQGVTKELAEASFSRDCRKDYRRASQIVQNALRSITNDSDLWARIDDSPEGDEAHETRLSIWRFVKSEVGLPSVSLTGREWVTSIRANIQELLKCLGIKNIPKLGQKIRMTGLGVSQEGLPLFSAKPQFPPIRQETIHQVKGESIDGVLVLGHSRFFNAVVDSVVEGDNSEERRLAYVAMTRARHVLVVGLPASHYDKHAGKWKAWGFSVL